MLNFFRWLVRWERKTVAQIVAPLHDMANELREALEHHEDQQVFHQEQAAVHANEAQKAAAVITNLTKLTGGAS